MGEEKEEKRSKWFFLEQTRGYRDRWETTGYKWKRIIGTVAIIIILATLSGSMIRYVDTGYIALIIDPLAPPASKVSEPISGPSYYIKMPWAYERDIYVSTDKYEDTIPCFTSDQLEMQVLIQIRWNLDVSRVRELYLSYPSLNYKPAIESITEQIMKTVTKNYTALETIAYREIVIAEIEKAVFKGLEAAPSLRSALASLEFNLRDIGYPANYTRSIEKKLVAEQEKIRASFERERILILANATAQQVVIEAKGEATARIIRASSIREAIRLISEATGITNTTRLVELYLYLEALKEMAPNINILILTMGPEGIPIIYQIPSG